MASKAEALRAKRLRDMLAEDYRQGPPNDAQAGETAGTEAYNANVDAVNAITEKGSILRSKNRTSESEARIASDKKAYDEALARKRQGK
jgi:hypothetical protein